MRPRWAPQSSKLLIRRLTEGRFDSDTFPRMIRSVTIVLALAASLAAQTPKLVWDGYDWQKIDRLTAEYPEYNRPFKRAYVQGLLDGKLYYYLQVLASDSVTANESFRDYLSRFSIDELVRGADEFYRDPAHLYLPVVTALAITALQAMGYPDSVVADYTEASRDWINWLTLLTTRQVPIRIEGIHKPALPLSPEELAKDPEADKPRKWYNPDRVYFP